MTHEAISRGSARPPRRLLRTVALRIGPPIGAGAVTGLLLAAAGVRPDLTGLLLSGAVSGVVAGTILAIARPNMTLSPSTLRYFADWFLLFGVWLGAALILGSRTFG